MSKRFSVLVLLLSGLVLTGCSSSNLADNGANNPQTIATPSQKPVAYSGDVKTEAELLEALQLADPEGEWTEELNSSEKLGQSVKLFTSNKSCYLYTYPSFQDAVNNDYGSYGDTWTLLGSYAQLGIIMLNNEKCYSNLTSVIRFPAIAPAGSTLEVLKPSKATISDCLVRHANCLLDDGVQFPSESTAYYKHPLKELSLLAKAGFCQVPLERPIDAEQFAGLDSCDLASDKGGSGHNVLISQESRDSSIIRIAASTPVDLKQDSYGKYMIYGDGWVIFSYESTEKQKQLFIDMNNVVKGTLVARY